MRPTEHEIAYPHEILLDFMIMKDRGEKKEDEERDRNIKSRESIV